MSRAFTREDDSDAAGSDIGERPVSPHRNLVTEAGLAAIDAELVRLRGELAALDKETERARMAAVSRDMRYWLSRRETAELSVPDRNSDVIRFGMTVTIESDAGKRQTWTIVGEDEADASQGRISHVSPMAAALFGKGVGYVVRVGGREWEVIEAKVKV
jgi:transcription elongation GreA/GreB family factor